MVEEKDLTTQNHNKMESVRVELGLWSRGRKDPDCPVKVPRMGQKSQQFPGRFRNEEKAIWVLAYFKH